MCLYLGWDISQQCYSGTEGVLLFESFEVCSIVLKKVNYIYIIVHHIFGSLTLLVPAVTNIVLMLFPQYYYNTLFVRLAFLLSVFQLNYCGQ